MGRNQAQQLVASSAAIVALVYGYRKFIEKEPAGAAGTPKNLLGFGELPNLGTFAIGWSFSFLTIAVLAQLSPTLGGYFAILIALGSLLANGTQIAKNLKTGLDKTGSVSANPAQMFSSDPTVFVGYFSGAAAVPDEAAAGAPKSLNLPKTV